MAKNKRYGFVLLNWNGEEDTCLCLSSLDSINYNGDFDIVVVDNGSSESSVKTIKKHIKNNIHRHVTLVELKTNTGFTGGHIEGLKYTAADIICLLNNDAVVAPNILTEVDVMIKTVGPDFGAIGGRAYFWNDNQKALDIWNEFFTYQKIDPTTATAHTIKGDPGESLAPKVVDNVSGACVFVNRAAITRAGYLDNSFFAYYEETDMFARFKRCGYEIFYCPTVRYWHRFNPNEGTHGASSKHIKNFSTTLILRNQFYFAVKNFERNYMIRFFAWYYVRFFSSIGRFLLIPSQRNISKIIIKTTFINFGKLPYLLRTRRELQNSLQGKPGYNSIIVKQAQRKTVVFTAIPSTEIIEYIQSNVSEDLRVHLRDGKKCKLRFVHRCVQLNAPQKQVNAIAAASARTESIIVIKNVDVQLATLKREFERVNSELPYRRDMHALYTFNKAFVNQVSSHNLRLHQKVDWQQKPYKITLFDRIIRKFHRPKRALIVLKDYLAYRLRIGGVFGLVRAIIGLLRNSVFNRSRAIVIIRAGAHEQNMHTDRTRSNQGISTENLSDFPISEIPVFINCRDRVESLLQTIAAIEKTGLKNIYLIDNKSSYPPLISYYNKTKYQVILLGENMGHKAPWESLAVKLISGGSPYIVTDPDVVLSHNYTSSTIEEMLRLFDIYPGYVKIGPGLDIDDLPDVYEHKQTVQKWEQQFWELKLDNPGPLMTYDAEIDTTFAIYRPNLGYITLPSIRLGGKHTAKHLPWYQDSQKPSEEELYYREHASSAVNTWNKDSLPDYLKDYSG